MITKNILNSPEYSFLKTDEHLAYYKNLLENMEDDRTLDWSTLNNLFISSIQ